MRIESDTRSGEGAGQGLGFEDGQGRVNVITLQRPPCERQPGNHRPCELPMDAQRHIVPRVLREDGECQLRGACSRGSPIEPFCSVVLKVTARIKRFAIHRHTAARAVTDASESAHDDILTLRSGRRAPRSRAVCAGRASSLHVCRQFDPVLGRAGRNECIPAPHGRRFPSPLMGHYLGYVWFLQARQKWLKM
jgi:hypothetical protein